MARAGRGFPLSAYHVAMRSYECTCTEQSRRNYIDILYRVSSWLGQRSLVPSRDCHTRELPLKCSTLCRHSAELTSTDLRPRSLKTALLCYILSYTVLHILHHSHCSIIYNYENTCLLLHMFSYIYHSSYGCRFHLYKRLKYQHRYIFCFY